ncbi:MAG: hypothetical protein QG648_50 [Patescibacteria group bacterium]|nr:hypothetical protein [Patescibacteria group bacterium]
MTNILVFYHIKDNDGVGSAWVAWKKFKKQAQYFGIDYHYDLDFDYHNKTIYFLDVHPNLEKINHLKQNNNRLILIDHHATSEKQLHLYDDYKFDLSHSAAVLSFQYFFPQEKTPRLLKYIEDIDLWKFQVPFSREINNALEFLGNDFTKWNKIARELENTHLRQKYLKIGKIITQYQDRLIEKLVSKAKLVKMEGRIVLAVNSPILISEVGNALALKKPPFAIVWSEINNKRWFSLRSDCSCDVSEIAEKYGGGGQRGAAAFFLERTEPFPWQEIK